MFLGHMLVFTLPSQAEKANGFIDEKVTTFFSYVNINWLSFKLQNEFTVTKGLVDSLESNVQSEFP